MSNNQMLFILIIAACYYFWYRSNRKIVHNKQREAQREAYQEDDGSPAVLCWIIKDSKYFMMVEVDTKEHAQTIVNSLNIHCVENVHVRHMGMTVMELAPNGLLIPYIETTV